tara:strand:+ start:4265 stop:4912 length:648 start_codon:yes stop_codon:yes gene_type:complete
MEQIKILLADDHALVRAGISALLAKFPNILILGEVENGREVLQFIKKNQPDILLLDISMKELNGLEVLRRITKEHQNVKIIMLSMHANIEYVIESIENGAKGYLLKDAAPSELEIAINAVLKGEIYLSPPFSKSALKEYLEKTNKKSTEQLTTRQYEILQLIAEGNSTKEIACKLFISVKTVETHRAHIMFRLNVKDVAGLVRYAIYKGIIQSDG